MLWALGSLHDEWDMPTIDDLKNHEYRDMCKERWKYLVILLQFWMDNNAMVHIRGGPVQPMSALAKLVKDMANYVLPSGFQISWKHIVQQTPWYHCQDFCRLLAVTQSRTRNHLEETVMQHHNKTMKLLCDQKCGDSRSTRQREEPCCEPIDMPTSGQFDLDEDLEVDVYNPLETPTDTPI